MGLFRIALYWLGGSIIGWFVKGVLLEMLRWPAEEGARQVGLQSLPFRIFDPVGGLVMAMQIAAVFGVIVASPLIFLELWHFARPALRGKERSWVFWIVPSAVGLFVVGIIFCYMLGPRLFEWFFGLNKALGVASEFALGAYIGFMLKLFLFFGLSFELPLVLMFLGAVGLVSSDWLLQQWKGAVVVLLAAVAIFSPTGDILTISIMQVAVLILYFLSILLMRIVEKRRRKADAREEATSEAASAPPVAIDPNDFYRSLAEPKS